MTFGCAVFANTGKQGRVLMLYIYSDCLSLVVIFFLETLTAFLQTSSRSALTPAQVTLNLSLQVNSISRVGVLVAQVLQVDARASFLEATLVLTICPFIHAKTTVLVTSAAGGPHTSC